MTSARPFTAFDLRPELLQAVADAGYTECTPIQDKALEPLLSGHDLTGMAETGSGKTAAFLLPILQKVTERKENPQALVVAPTRELAQQVAAEAQRLARHCDIRTVAVYGGTGLGSQKNELLAGVDLVVGTPGRLIDFIRQTYLRLSSLRFVVLDEADRMLDMGFINDVKFIMGKAPLSRQTMLFSATLSREVRELAENFMFHPVRVEVEQPSLTARNIEQWAEPARSDNAKTRRLVELFEKEKPEQALVFVATRERTSMVAQELSRVGLSCACISSLLSQANRERVLADFREGRIRVLVATDVAGRGLDIKGVSHVVNFDVPSAPDDYVHRVGRTARAGARGRAMTLFTRVETPSLRQIERHIGIDLAPRDGGDKDSPPAAEGGGDGGRRRRRGTRPPGGRRRGRG